MDIKADSLSEDAKKLYQSYVDVQATGNRIGFLKKERIPAALELVNTGKLVEVSLGLFKLKE